MSILKTSTSLISTVNFTDKTISVTMTDGNIHIRNIADFPNLRKGTLEQWANYSIEGGGRWLHWDELDEDLSAEGFIQE